MSSSSVQHFSQSNIMAPTLGHLPEIWPSANQELSCFQPTFVALQELRCVDAQGLRHLQVGSCRYRSLIEGLYTL